MRCLSEPNALFTTGVPAAFATANCVSPSLVALATTRCQLPSFTTVFVTNELPHSNSTAPVSGRNRNSCVASHVIRNGSGDDASSTRTQKATDIEASVPSTAVFDSVSESDPSTNLTPNPTS